MDNYNWNDFGKVDSKMKNYNEEGMRMTECCQSASTFCDVSLVCKTCFNDVEIGEGDGNEYKGDKQ